MRPAGFDKGSRWLPACFSSIPERRWLESIAMAIISPRLHRKLLQERDETIKMPNGCN